MSIAAATWISLVVVSAGPIQKSEPPAIGRYQLVRARNARPAVVVAPRRGKRAALRVQFAVGALDDGISPGLTRLAQHVLLAANRRGRYEGLLERLHAADASLTLDTGQSRCAFVLEAPTNRFLPLAKALLAQLMDPDIGRRGLNQARQRLFHESPSFDATMLATMFSQATLADYGFSAQPLGEKDSLRTLSMGEVRAHIRKYFRPANATVVAAGRFGVRELKKAVLRYSGGRRRGAPSRPPLEAGLFQLRARIEVHLVGLPVPLGTPQQAAVMRMAASILRERVQEDFRAMGVVYSTSVVSLRRPWLDFVLIILPTHDSSTTGIEADINQRIRDLSNDNVVDEKAFERYRTVLLHHLDRLDRSPALLVDELAMAETRTPWFGTEVTKAVRELDPVTFRNEVAKWARPDRATYVLLAPRLQNRRRAR